ncbi:hypothetical protein GDO78_015098 [Eleutherodactylus coqui]|uniref:Mut7-C RNAse domain-containing protein n=1 Tax=Eleutherodactylus coqui TaxID=57060 RepID=A0A8J6ELF3_ELECQ|nr:hypothetical protein GDO78_015098 [Eleutherodactylus coqui]
MSSGARPGKFPGVSLKVLKGVCNCDKYLHISQGRMVQLMKLRDYLEEIGGQQDPPHASEPERLCHGENLQWMEEMGISSESLLLTNGAQLQLDAVPAGLLEKVPLFFCCSQCGKIFWEGSHFGRVVSQFKDVLQTNGECIYQSANPQGL